MQTASSCAPAACVSASQAALLQGAAHSVLPSTVSQLSEPHDMEEIGHLVLKLSQSGKDGDLFKQFAEHVSQVVPGLTHLRYPVYKQACGSQILHLLDSSVTALTANCAMLVVMQCYPVAWCKAECCQGTQTQRASIKACSC